MNKTNARTRIFSTILISVVAMSLLAACGPKEPAVDPNLIYTQAAETVAAQMTETLAAVPPVTETPEPSATPEMPTETATSAMIPTFTPNAGAATVAAIPTSTKIVTGGGDKAAYAYQSPTDGRVFAPGEVFQMAFGLQNVGSTTWTQDYKLVFAGGTQISANTSVSHDPAGGEKETIPPGEKAEFILLATAPTVAGDYKTTYFFYNPHGVFLFEVYLTFKVE